MMHRLSSLGRAVHDSSFDNMCGDIAARLPSGLDRRSEVLYNTVRAHSVAMPQDQEELS